MVLRPEMPAPAPTTLSARSLMATMNASNAYIACVVELLELQAQSIAIATVLAKTRRREKEERARLEALLSVAGARSEQAARRVELAGAGLTQAWTTIAQQCAAVSKPNASG